MWWSSRLGAAALALGLAAWLGGCGFRPLYAEPDEGASALAELAAIRIERIPDRTGQQLREELTFLLTPRCSPAPARYVLSVSLSEQLSEIATARTGLATRANLRVDAAFQLTAVGDGRVLVADRTTSITGFDLLDQEFASVISATDARTRAIQRIAQTIRYRLAAHFAAEADDGPEPRG